MPPEAFTAYVRRYCDWAEAPGHDVSTVHRLLLLLLEGAPRLKTASEVESGRKPLGLPQEVSWSEIKRFADFPFQCYPPSFWPEVHPEGQFTDEDLAHIYAELRYGLQLIEQRGIEAAVQYWRDSYFFHWGHHASAAVWAIENYGPKTEESEPGVAPNGGPASVGNSIAPGGPPSAS